MRKILTVFMLVAFAALFLLNNVLVSAQAADYNFGTTQQSNIIAIEPGKTAITKIFFYNIWGNRVTHIILDIAQKPEGWKVEIQPELNNVTLNVTGVIVTAEENLYATPCKLDSSWCPTSDLTPREGVEYISGSNIQGKIPAKYALITVTAPENVSLWQEYPLTISASASWYGEAGTVALTQARDFSYTIKTVTNQYTEEIIVANEKSPVIKWLANNWAYMVIALLLLVVIFLIRKPKRKKWK